MKIEKQFNKSHAPLIGVQAPIIKVGHGLALGIKLTFLREATEPQSDAIAMHLTPNEAVDMGQRLLLAGAPPAPAGRKCFNAREKAAAISEWLGYQDEDLSAGLRSVADAEKLYDYWQARNDLLPEMADEASDDESVDVAAHRVVALGYDPLE